MGLYKVLFLIPSLSKMIELNLLDWLERCYTRTNKQWLLLFVPEDSLGHCIMTENWLGRVFLKIDSVRQPAEDPLSILSYWNKLITLLAKVRETNTHWVFNHSSCMNPLFSFRSFGSIAGSSLHWWFLIQPFPGLHLLFIPHQWLFSCYSGRVELLLQRSYGCKS